MTKFNYIIVTLLLSIMPVLTFGQTVYEGQVVNKVTELTIPGVTVKLLKANTGTQTNAQGYFRISVDNAAANDTLQFSSIGYDTFKQPVNTKPLQMIILLNASNTALNEVRVTAGKSKPVTLNNFNISDLRELETSITTYHTMPMTEAVASQCAKYFTAPQADMMLTTVKLGRRNLEWSSKSPYTQFLVHVVLPNPFEGKPGRTIFTKKVSLTDNAQLVTIDFVKDKVTIPGTKFFVVIERLYIPINEIITLTYKNDYDKNGKLEPYYRPRYTISYQPNLVVYTQYKSHAKWHRLGDRLWAPPGKWPEFNEITPTKIWITRYGTWREELSSHELALSVTLTS